MEERREYDVLKIVRHSDRCYLSSDRIRGMPLVWWLKYHTLITREQAFAWIKGLAEELSDFHHTKDNPCYQYLNPYSIIVGENDRWYLLDLASDGQEELVRLMQRRSVREQFLPPDNQYYQKSSIRGDIYSTGKIIQYLLTVAAIEPKIGRADEHRLQAIISKCLDQESKHAFRDMQELSEQLSKLNSPKEKKNTRKWICVILMLIVVGAAVCLGKMVLQSQVANDSGEDAASYANNLEQEMQYVEELHVENEQMKTELEETKKEAEIRETKLLYELVLLNFKLEDYRECQVYLEEMKESNSFADDLYRLCGYMSGEVEVDPERELELLLMTMEQEIPDSADKRYDYCLWKGYGLLTTEEAEAERTRLAENCLASEEWMIWAGDDLVQKVAAVDQETETVEKNELEQKEEADAPEKSEASEEVK